MEIEHCLSQERLQVLLALSIGWFGAAIFKNKFQSTITSTQVQNWITPHWSRCEIELKPNQNFDLVLQFH